MSKKLLRLKKYGYKQKSLNVNKRKKHASLLRQLKLKGSDNKKKPASLQKRLRN